jgi:pimeloyl-ACP methyl ester carboxylesterase
VSADPIARYRAFCAAHPTRRLDVLGHCWEYIDAGAGDPPLILLPGGFGVPATSSDYILALAPQRRVIALGYPPDVATISALCDGLDALLGALGVGSVWLLGGSASGFVAQAFVRSYPRRVVGLILAQSGAPRPERAWLSRACAGLLARLPMPLIFSLLRLAIRADMRGDSAGRRFWRAHFADVLAQQSRTALLNRFRLAADFDANERLGPGDLRAWPGRLALIESAGDGLIDPRERAALRALYPGAEIHTLDGGHNDSFEQPAAQIAQIARIIGADGEGETLRTSLI